MCSFRLFVCLLLAACLSAQTNGLLLTGAGASGSHGVSVTPGFVNITSNNSILTNAVNTQTSAGNTTCADYAWCGSFADGALSGNLGIVAMAYSSTPAPTNSITDDKSNTWSLLTASTASSSKVLQIGYAPNLISATHAVKWHFSAGVSQVQGAVSQAYHIATTSPVDASSCIVGASSTTATGPTLVTTQTNDYIFMAVLRTGTPASSSGTSAGSGYALRSSQYQDGLLIEDGVASSSGSVSPTMNLGGATTYIACAVAFKSANTGTVPSGFYAESIQSWSTPTGTSGNFTLQNPSTGNLLVAAISSGGTGPMIPSGITDGTNTWQSTGTVNNFSGSGAGVTAEWYVPSALSSSGLMTFNTSGTGDATFTVYSFKGAAASPFVWRTPFQGNDSTVNDFTVTGASVTSSYPSWAGTPQNAVMVVVGGQADNTSVSCLNPATSPACWFDSATVGGEVSNGPFPLWENNPWAHWFNPGDQTAVAQQTVSFGQGNTTGAIIDWNADILAFLSGSGIGSTTGIIHGVPCDGNITLNCANSGASDTLTITVPPTTAGNLGVVSVGWYDGGTARTLLSACFDGTTCATANKFTQVAGALSTNSANQSRTDIWELSTLPAGATTVTLKLSGAFTGFEAVYYEVSKPSGTWGVDVANNKSNTAAAGTATGAAVTPTGSAEDFCVGSISVSGSTTSVPKSGTAWIYDPWIFASGDGYMAYLTSSKAAISPQTSVGSGTYQGSTACFQ